jgi:hypothetical protein
VSKLFQRAYVLTVDTTRITGLRVAFSIKKTLKPEPNTAEIRVWNLNAERRKSIKDRHVACVLTGGYLESAGLLFSGDARFITHTQTGPDWVSKIVCGDGERAYSLDRVSASFGPGTPVAAVMDSVAGTLQGISTGNVKQALAGVGGVFKNGFAAADNSFKTLQSLSRSQGLNLSIQDGAFSLLSENGLEPGTAILLTPETGLVGSPETASPEKKGGALRVKARSLLQANLRPGRAVELRSAAIAGVFRVEVVEHKGDTHGGEWYTDLELKPVTL